MEEWSEEFSEKFGKEWAEKMERWGERFGREMEKRAIVEEKHAKRMEKRVEALQKRREAQQAQLEERRQRLKERQSDLVKRVESRRNKVKKVIRIKIPKKAKLKMNVRHGELKVSDLYNAEGDMSHSVLVANYIDGSDTSINVSYSPVIIEHWNLGTLNLNFVDRAQIKNAHDLVLNSKSSNVSLDNLSSVGIIDGSFGDLIISNLSKSFKNLNMILENSDAEVYISKDVGYDLYFNGNKSRLNKEKTAQKTIRNSKGQNRTISINAKYSSVVLN